MVEHQYTKYSSIAIVEGYTFTIDGCWLSFSLGASHEKPTCTAVRVNPNFVSAGFHHSSTFCQRTPLSVSPGSTRIEAARILVHRKPLLPKTVLTLKHDPNRITLGGPPSSVCSISSIYTESKSSRSASHTMSYYITEGMMMKHMELTLPQDGHLTANTKILPNFWPSPLPGVLAILQSSIYGWNGGHCTP